MDNMIIAGKKCETCLYGRVLEDSKPLKVECDARDKSYYFGQCIPCEDYKKLVIEEEECQ